MNEPDYYKSNGLSPIGAFKQGLISKEEYRGFLIGNIIKYTIRAGKKEDAVKDLNKARHYIDFYLELTERELFEKQCITKAPTLTVDVNNDIDWDKFKEDISKALEEANEHPIIMEKPTDDPHIIKLDLSDAMYDENGELKPEAREKIKEYIEDRREKSKQERGDKVR